MLGVLILSAASFLTSPVEEIVLRSGQVIAVEELVRLERGSLIFSTSGGTLYSVRLSDVDVEKTDQRLAANQIAPVGESGDRSAIAEATHLPRKLPVSAEEKKRILAEMEDRSHTGRTSVPPDTSEEAPPQTRKAVEGDEDEAKWRELARRHREAVERAKEQLASARQREKDLNAMILFFAGGSGDASQYSYLTHQLADLRSRMPQLEAEVKRAEKAWFEFSDDARMKGILPGWLR